LHGRRTRVPAWAFIAAPCRPSRALRIDFTEGWASPLLPTLCERLRAALSKLTGRPALPCRCCSRPQRAHAHSEPQAASELQAGQPRLWPGEGSNAGPDPYADEARHTAELVAARVPEIGRWWFAFQSQGASGGPWIGPSVEETLASIATEGVKALISSPSAFSATTLKYSTMWIFCFADKRPTWDSAGAPESLNASRTLARAVADLALRGFARLKG